MKKIILSFIILFISNTSFCQDLQSLEIETNKMFKATSKMNFDEILDFSYPKLYDILSREQMKEMLEMTFTNEQFDISFLPIDPEFDYTPIKKIEKKSLSVIKYNLGMAMRFNEPVDDETANIMIESLQAQGESYADVKYDKEKNTFYIKGKSTMIAIADEVTENKWKFITYDKNKRQIAEMLLSDSILNKLGL
jgi:alpha-N-acetylglucosamine transferase